MRAHRQLCALLLLTACSSDPSTVAGGSPSAAPSAAPTVAQSTGRIKAPPASKLAETDEFGLVAGLSRRGTRLEADIDRVDMLGGAEAEAAAAAAHADFSNDYFLVNDNPLLRHYRIAPDAVVWGSIGLTGRPDPDRSDLAAWTVFVETPQGKQTLFHFDVEGDQVVGIEEQYRP
jgi:hypothetical protein